MHYQITNWESKRRNQKREKSFTGQRKPLSTSNPLRMPIIILRERKPINLNDNKFKKKN